MSCVNQYLVNIKTKMMHTATHVENNMVSEVNVTICSKNKGG